MKKKVKFLSWDKNRPLDSIEREIKAYLFDGWTIVSHSHSLYGMSVLLIKEESKS